MDLNPGALCSASLTHFASTKFESLRSLPDVQAGVLSVLPGPNQAPPHHKLSLAGERRVLTVIT